MARSAVGARQLVSDAERESAGDALRLAWLEGRLTLPELEHRLARALVSRTGDELDALLLDLPRRERATALASWSRRSAALVLDHVVLLLAGVGAVAAGVEAGHTVAALVLTALLAPVAALAYFTLAHGSRSGRSVGERVCGIAVRCAPGRSPAARRATYGQAFGRALLLYVFAGLAFWGVGLLNFLWPLWDARKQAWHDKLTGTIVVRAPAHGLERRRWLRRLRTSLRRRTQ